MTTEKPVLFVCLIFTSSLAFIEGQSATQSNYNSVARILDNRGQLTGKECGSETQEWALKSAQFYAYCFEQYGNLTDGTMRCNSSQCKACLKVCELQNVGNESNCWSQCGSNATEACKHGCSFYNLVYDGVSSRKFNLSNDKIPRNYSMHPRVGSGDATSFVLKWNATQSQSTQSQTLIVYVILARKVKNDDMIPLQSHQPPPKMRPIKMSLTTSRLIYSSNICSTFPNANHVLGITFDFEVVPVSKHGYLRRNERVIETTSFKFPSFEYLDKVYVNGPGVFTPPNFSDLGRMTYKIHWSGYSKNGPKVTSFEVTYDVKGKQCSGSYYPLVVVKANAASASVSVVIERADLWKDCIFIFSVVPIATCIYGNTLKTNVTYTGCHTNCNPSTTKLPGTTTTSPIVIASLKSDSTKFICTSNTTNSSEGCSSGHYNKTMMWNLPTGVPIIEIDCRLYEIKSINYGSIIQTVPMMVRKAVLPRTAKSLVLTNLLPKRNYVFKVYVRTSVAHVPYFSKMAGFSFTTADLPTIRPPLTTPIATERSTTTLRKPTNIPIKKEPKNNITIGLAAGLGGALFVVIVIAMLLILRERRRRKRDATCNMKGNSLGGNDISFVTYQVDPPDQWELQMENIIFGEALGEGAFGKVYLATVSNVVMQSSSVSTESLNKYVKMGPRHDSYRQTAVTMKAAVKILQDRSNEQQKDDFLEEIKLMKEVGQHKNIVSMLGCVTRGDTLCLVVEFMPYGDLLHYLRGRRSKILGQPAYANPNVTIPKYIHCDSAQHMSTENLIPPTPEMARTVLHDTKRCGCEPDGGSSAGDDEDISPDDLLTFSWQIASGMEFLSKKGFVHRDLAARNVLVGPHKSCKISDFGLTRLVYEEKVYMGRKSRKLPIKWMSTEAILDQIFTAYSDVWSFGVLVFEIVTLGGTPYPTMTGQEILRFLRSGNRIEKPENCSDEIYSVMKACWLEDPLKRPSFTDIREKFEVLISEGTPYVELNLDNSNPYYNVASFISLDTSTVDSLSDDDNEAEWESRFSMFDRKPNASTNSSVNEGFEKEAGNKCPSINGSGAIVDEEGYLSATRGPLESVSSAASSTTPLADHLTNQRAGGSNNGSPLLQKHRIKPKGSSGSYVWSDKRNSSSKNIVTSVPTVNEDNDNEHQDAFVTDNYLQVRPTI